MPRKKPTYYYGRGKNIVQSRCLYTVIEEDEDILENNNQDVINLGHSSSVNMVFPALEVGYNHDHPYGGHANIAGEGYGCCVIS